MLWVQRCNLAHSAPGRPYLEGTSEPARGHGVMVEPPNSSRTHRVHSYVLSESTTEGLNTTTHS